LALCWPRQHTVFVELNLFGPRRIEWKANIMVWVIIVAVFLGTLVTSVSMFFIFSRREQIREALRKSEHVRMHRMESRTRARVEVELSSPNGPSSNEITLTENISRHGARVVTKRRWQPSDGVIVKWRGNRHSLARIAYCKPLKGDAFAIGLQFSSAVVSWMV
jgi:hypothetical protein